MDGPFQFKRSANQRIDVPLLGFQVEVGGVSLERIALRSTAVVFLLLAALVRAFLRNAVGDEVQHVEARQPLLLEQVERVRFVFAKHRGQDIAPIDHLLLGREGVNRRPLKYPFHSHRLLRLGFHSSREALDCLFQKLLEAFLQAREVRSAGTEDLSSLCVFEQGQQQVLEREVLVPHPLRLGDREPEASLQLFSDQRGGHQSSGSIETLNGNSFSRASFSTVFTFVSATS